MKKTLIVVTDFFYERTGYKKVLDEIIKISASENRISYVLDARKSTKYELPKNVVAYNYINTATSGMIFNRKYLALLPRALSLSIYYHLFTYLPHRINYFSLLPRVLALTDFLLRNKIKNIIFIRSVGMPDLVISALLLKINTIGIQHGNYYTSNEYYKKKYINEGHVNNVLLWDQSSIDFVRDNLRYFGAKLINFGLVTSLLSPSNLSSQSACFDIVIYESYTCIPEKWIKFIHRLTVALAGKFEVVFSPHPHLLKTGRSISSLLQGIPIDRIDYTSCAINLVLSMNSSIGFETHYHNIQTFFLKSESQCEDLENTPKSLTYSINDFDSLLPAIIDTLLGGYTNRDININKNISAKEIFNSLIR